MSNAIVKNLSFGSDAKDNVFAGITKLTQAVSSTLGASGKCVMLEDQTGEPIITKDGVTVADSITLLDPVENMGATLLKQAARKTVREAGDGTTTATVLAHSILDEAYKIITKENARDLKQGITTATEKVIEYLDSIVTMVKDDMIDQVATISTNNDPVLGKIIADAFRSVGKNGVVVLNSPGTIDSDYRGEVGVILINHSESDFIISNGDRIAQMVIAPFTKVNLVEVNDLNPSQRAEGGFGSTGNN